MPQIFISYSHKDASTIEELKLMEYLGKDNQYHVWQDIKGMQVDKGWLIQIQQNLESSVAIIVFTTDNLLESQWVMFECAYAMALGIPIIPYFDDKNLNENRHTPLYDLLSQQHGAKNRDDLRHLIQKLSKKSVFHTSIENTVLQLLTHVRIFFLTIQEYIEHNRLTFLPETIEVTWKAISTFFSEVWGVRRDLSSQFTRRQQIDFDEVVNQVRDFTKGEFSELTEIFKKGTFEGNLYETDIFQKFKDVFLSINAYISKSFGSDDEFVEFQEYTQGYKNQQRYSRYSNGVPVTKSFIAPLNDEYNQIIYQFLDFLDDFYMPRKPRK